MCLSVHVSHFDLIGYSDNTMQDTEDVAIYRTQTKLRQGNVFTPVCDSVHRGRSLSGGVLCPGGSLSGRSSCTVKNVRYASYWTFQC